MTEADTGFTEAERPSTRQRLDQLAGMHDEVRKLAQANAIAAVQLVRLSSFCYALAWVCGLQWAAIFVLAAALAAQCGGAGG
jgi:hypothetical protein